MVWLTGALQLRTENKDIPHFLPEHPSYFRFPQEEKKVPTVRRETLRNLWDQACYGGDFDSAIKVMCIIDSIQLIQMEDCLITIFSFIVQILIVMTDKSSVEFSDFIKFLTLLREQRGNCPYTSKCQIFCPFNFPLLIFIGRYHTVPAPDIG
jgi:hypothetical protein